MGNAYQPEFWRDIFVVLSSSAAALIGLLFIATSMHLDEIVNNPILRRRAFNNTRYLLIIFVEALLILMQQPLFIQGTELIIINIFGLWLSVRVVYTFVQKKGEYSQGGGRISRSITFVVGFSLGIAGGASLIEHHSLGIYLLITSSIILLVTTVLNAWSIMVGVGQSEKTTKVKRDTARHSR